MSSNTPQKSSFQLLWAVFTANFKRVHNALMQFIGTSWGIFRFSPIHHSLHAKENFHDTDVKYAYRVFEYILIYLFILKLFSTGPDVGDGDELIRDFAILLLYFIELAIIIFLGSVVHTAFFKAYEKRKVEAYFVYAYSFLFLPSYLVVHVGYGAFQNDDEDLGTLLLLLMVIWAIFLFYFFFRMNRAYHFGKLKSTVLASVLAVSISLFLFFSLAIVLGVGYAEM